MSEAEKEAIRLYDLFHEWTDSDTAKQCALIAVDEKMKMLSPYIGNMSARKYLEKVKAEIEKL